MMPHMVMGAWVGGDDRRVRFPKDSRTGQGAHTALPIVGTFINYCSSDPSVPWKKQAFEPPNGFIMPEAPEESQQIKDRIKGRIGW